MAGVIVPFAKAVYLCEEVDVEGGMTNLYALFNAFRAPQFPYRRSSFVCFVQLLGGLGDVPTYIDVRRADDRQLIHNTDVRVLHFPNRNTLLQLAFEIEGCVFETPGVYLAELYCDNTWVADTAVSVLEATP